jgi:hypothetical protein
MSGRFWPMLLINTMFDGFGSAASVQRNDGW